MPRKLDKTKYRVESAPDGSLGFDVSHPITSDEAKAAFAAGFSFCVRYVARLEPNLEPIGSPDITFDEAQDILDSGLALFLVQHVSNGGWFATESLGKRFGGNAANYAFECGFPPGVNIFLDLEEVSPGSSPREIQGFCNEWYKALSTYGYIPGVYIGSKNGLDAQQLFSGTLFEHFWHAASQADPPKPRSGDRGYQLFQPLNLTSSQKSKLSGVNLIDKGNGDAFEIDLQFANGETIPDVDIDFTIVDNDGGKVQWLKK
ncbi:DUF1906 domain-containing protein [Pseudanabaena biceps]|nr:DUF1906 domain-containing protein [Pseudanabaena biceps]